MQLDTINRLRHLGEIATTRHLASRELADRIRTVRDERRRAAERIERLTTGLDYTDRAGVDAEVKRLQARLADLNETVADLDHRQQDANSAFQSAKTLEVRCRDFAAENGLPVPEEIVGDAEAYSGGRLPGGLGMISTGATS
jgi:chromosome segregation ATPase